MTKPGSFSRPTPDDSTPGGGDLIPEDERFLGRPHHADRKMSSCHGPLEEVQALARRAAGVLRLNDMGGWTNAAPELYPHQWSWDSAFIAIGLAHLDTRRAAREHGDLGRIANALTSAREFKEAGDEATIIFDGAGTKWVPELSKSDHRLNGDYEKVKGSIAGACDYCADSFGVKGEIEKSDISLLEKYSGHPSLQRLVSEGCQVITF